MDGNQRKIGFAPVFNADSRILILGSFPSVKSREIDFYYGNKQNRFWKTVCGYFHENVPETVEGKRTFLYSRKIALWDMVTACEIDGSADVSVRNEETADLNEIFRFANIEAVLLNGSLAYNLFLRSYADISIPYYKLPSTSPANPLFDEKSWKEALDCVFAVD